MNLEENVISRTTKTEKLFNFERGHCSYQNIESFRKKRENDQDHQVKIFNTICKQDSKKLMKLTQIQFRDKIVTIQDQYYFHVEPNIQVFSNDRSTTANNGSSDGSQNNNTTANSNSNVFPKKKKLIFKKKLAGVDNTVPQLQKRNTKNIAKNFCRAFIAYLDEKKQKAMLLKTKSLISNMKFNNRTIQKIATDKQINYLFKYFLLNKAQQWINTSKISDKQIHKKAIELYLELIEQSGRKIEAEGDQQFAQNSGSNYNSNQLFEEESEQMDNSYFKQLGQE